MIQHIYTPEEIKAMETENAQLKKRLEPYEEKERKETRTLLEIAEEERP